MAKEDGSFVQVQEREDVLREVIQTHKGRLLSIIQSRVRDQVEAEDVLQDVFEEYLEAYDLGYAIEKISSWLVTVARNKILDRFRRRKTERTYEHEVENEATAESPERPDDEWSRLILRQELVEAIETLPPDQREVFILHELEGKSFEEIASETGVALNTLLSRKRYAVVHLRNYLKEIYDELES